MTPDEVMEVVDRIMSVEWVWGTADCCASGCDVFAELHGIDPMARIRGAYASAGDAARLIKTWGGFPAMVEALADQSGLIISEGLPGEIGLSAPYDSGGPDGRSLLICIEPGAWAGKTQFGYGVISTAERCWRA